MTSFGNKWIVFDQAVFEIEKKNSHTPFPLIVYYNEDGERVIGTHLVDQDPALQKNPLPCGGRAAEIADLISQSDISSFGIVDCSTAECFLKFKHSRPLKTINKIHQAHYQSCAHDVTGLILHSSEFAEHETVGTFDAEAYAQHHAPALKIGA